MRRRRHGIRDAIECVMLLAVIESELDVVIVRHAVGGVDGERRVRGSVRAKGMPLINRVNARGQNVRRELHVSRAGALRFGQVIRAEGIGVRAGRARERDRAGGAQHRSNSGPRAHLRSSRIIDDNVVYHVGKGADGRRFYE